jgi:drug/metabolite transporter (DMT)-like permease
VAHRLAAPPAAVWAALGAIYVIWGATYLGMEIAIETLPPFLMASLRFLLAGAILFAIFRPRERPTRRQWLSAAIVGAFLLVGGNAMVAVAQQRIDTGVAALIVATVPLFLALGDFAATGRRLAPQAVLGIVVGFAGIALLVHPGGDIDLFGAFICLLAPLSWAIGSLYARTAQLPSNLLLGSGMEMLAGGALLLGVGYASGERLHVTEVSARSWIALAFLVVFGSNRRPRWTAARVARGSRPGERSWPGVGSGRSPRPPSRRTRSRRASGSLRVCRPDRRLLPARRTSVAPRGHRRGHERSSGHEARGTPGRRRQRGRP